MNIVKREYRDERGNGGYNDFECVDLDSAHEDEIAYTANGGELIEFYVHGAGVSLTLDRARQLHAALQLLLDR